MIYLFFAVLFIEMLTILLLLFKTPLRKLLIIGLDRAKRGRAPLVVKSVAATFFIMMMYNVYTVMEIQRRPADVNNPTDQIILAYHMLEAALMGNFLFLCRRSIPLCSQFFTPLGDFVDQFWRSFSFNCFKLL